MKTVVWVVFGLLAAFWTGGAWLVSELIHWAAQGLASGASADLGRVVAEWPMPEWVAVLGEPGWIYAVQDGVAWALERLAAAAPWAGSVVGWLVPLVWVLWGLVLLLMLALAGGVHLLVRRYHPAQPHAA
jgi:hypothetical protein